MAHGFIVAAFAVIFDEQGRVLLSHRTDMDLWNLPGGGMELGETPWDAVVREVAEETGLIVEVVRLTGVYSKPDKNEVVFNFLCRITGGTLTFTDEADRHEWFVLDALPSNTSQKQVARIRDAAARQIAPFLRVHTGPSSRELLARVT